MCIIIALLIPCLFYANALKAQHGPLVRRVAFEHTSRNIEMLSLALGQSSPILTSLHLGVLGILSIDDRVFRGKVLVFYYAARES